MTIRKFEGWYFKHQLENNTVAFIPGVSADGAFVQMFYSNGARFYKMNELCVKDTAVYTENCVFSKHGCKVNLPGVYGEIQYLSPTPLSSDIMGPFRFFPMECRHGVISMSHSLKGSLTIDGTKLNFDGGNGYIEKDSGISFPTSYQWLQCNDFNEPLSIMVSVARIPFCGFNFTGCICAVIFGGHEYRFATYKGVRILKSDEKYIILSQKNLILYIEILPTDLGHKLRSPISGQMNGTIRERANAEVHIKLYDHSELLFDLKSPHATYEYVI